MHKEVNKWLLHLANEALEEKGEGLTAAENEHVAGYKGSIWKIFCEVVQIRMNWSLVVLLLKSGGERREGNVKYLQVLKWFALSRSDLLSYQEGSTLSLQVSRGSIYVKWLLRNSARSCIVLQMSMPVESFLSTGKRRHGKPWSGLGQLVALWWNENGDLGSRAALCALRHSWGHSAWWESPGIKHLLVATTVVWWRLTTIYCCFFFHRPNSLH